MRHIVRSTPFMRHRTPYGLWLGMAIAVLVLAGCGPAATESETTAGDDTATEADAAAEEGTADAGGGDQSADDLPTFRLANQTNLFGLSAIVADANGYFADQGVNVEQVFNASGADRASLVLGGTADASILGVGSGMRGFENDDWHMVGTMVQAGGANALSCAPSAGIDSVADIQGSGIDIATAEGSGTTLTFQYVIQPEFDVTDDDWNIVNLPTSERLAAVAGGSAQCMLNQEPILTQAAEEGIAEVVEDSVYAEYDPNHQQIYVRTDFLEQEGGEEATARFLAALVDGAEFIQSNQEDAAQIYIDFFAEQGIEVGDQLDVILIGVEKQGYEVCIGDDFRDNLQRWGEIQVDTGELSSMPDFEQNVEFDLNHRATGGC